MTSQGVTSGAPPCFALRIVVHGADEYGFEPGRRRDQPRTVATRVAIARERAGVRGMAICYLKRAAKTPASEAAAASEIAGEMLAEIQQGGEAAARSDAERLDGWRGEIIVDLREIEARTRGSSLTLKRDIDFACAKVRAFAEAQRASVREFSVELSPGLVAGQRLIPVNVVGCYVPTGRYAHIASAYMSIATAKAAGVGTVVACSAPYRGEAFTLMSCMRCRPRVPTSS